ncbi:MAG TPA: DUF427 domain-containing protein [Solirubrobacteraceae bacterium]|jgi:uncharacterized protein (DUF427 family)|nr:DUF427 domain-containing protein [Solirubrobacteraceae bacterium]
MGMMTGTGPLSARPGGRFNFKLPWLGAALYIEPSPKRVRVVFGGETIADSRNVTIVHESGHQPVYYFPPADVRTDLFIPTDRHTHCPRKGDASYYTISAGGRTEESAAWYYPDPLPGAEALRDLIAFYWKRMDGWFEEDEEIVGHPADPYHRIDTRASSAHVRVSLKGELLADSTRAVALFESNLPTRWYLPREDVQARLEPSDTTTLCPYKGTAAYHSVVLSDGERVEDLIWSYAEPLPEAERVRDLLCFYNERVEIELDGQAQERPESPWSHATTAGRQAGREP